FLPPSLSPKRGSSATTLDPRFGTSVRAGSLLSLAVKPGDAMLASEATRTLWAAEHVRCLRA
ncbi:MAG: hypothetical protein ACLQHS_05115, partial [Candidatus Limnocylindrales bacterium]